MAIGYARAEFVKRSSGKNACAKAAYNARTRIEFEGNCALDPEIYDWSSKQSPAFHEVLLPEGSNEKFESPKVLWNRAEATEKRFNSQVALEVLLALPDDKVISLEDRIHLTRTFIQTHFVRKGLAAQIDIHPPEKKIQITRDAQDIGLSKGMAGNIEKKGSHIAIQLENGRSVSFDSQEFTGFIEKQSNWHVHVLITTRRFLKSGLEFGEKARDLMPRLANGKVISGPDWGKLWTDHQNSFFKEKGLDLRVDIPGIDPQEHLGPFRMRGRAFALLQEHGRILEENVLKARDVARVLEKITDRQSVFTKEDVERFLQKHIPFEFHEEFSKEFWRQEAVVPLVDTKTGELTGKFSSTQVVEEEQRILRLADSIHDKAALKMERASITSQNLNTEQQEAFKKVLSGNRLSCINGFAGAGKSHLLNALKEAYSSAGYRVRGLGPDSATADVLKEKGFQNTENIYRFLFALNKSKREIASGKEVWILDEAGKVANKPLLEFLKEAEKKNVQVIFSGDFAQLNSVGRGGMFKVFCDRFAPHMLEQIQRQKNQRQQEIAKNLAKGELGMAIDKLTSDSAIRWASTKKEAIEQLISCWARDTRSFPQASTLIISHSNDEVRILNEMVRIIRKQRGELSEKEFACETTFGKIYLGIGDLIEFRKNEKDLGFTNGMTGVVIEAEPDRFVVSIRDDGQKLRTAVFNPKEYHTYQLGYASTYFRSQGKTINRAYVLHSPSLNKRMFYVGLTRHVDEAYYFVSKDQAYCLSDLKRQALREDTKESTLNFRTLQDIQKDHAQGIREQEVKDLLESGSFLDRMKGYGISAYDMIKGRAYSIGKHIRDRSPNKDFFNPDISETKMKASVNEVLPDKNALETILSEEKRSDKVRTDPPEQGYVGQLVKGINPEGLIKKYQERKRPLWNALAPEKQEIIGKYFSSAGTASSLKSVVDLHAESSSHKLESTAYYKEWHEACGKRNEMASELLQKVSTSELGDFLGKKIAAIIQDQASRNEAFIAQQKKAKAFDIEGELKANIEPLLFSLFPEGPYKRERNSMRFGGRGSLSVVCAGEKSGQYYDFERGEGGGALKLIQRELGFGRLEAIDWAKGFLGNAHEIKVPKVFLKAPTKCKDSDWVSLTPDPKHPAPSLENLANGKLHHYFEEVARHAYCDAQGKLLYYVLRLKDRSDSTKKITPPLSYGYWISNPEKLGWDLKGFQSEKNFLYNLADLNKTPAATVLVVEGEKTADRALEKFPGKNFVCITWPGGAGAVRFADWSLLAGRNVVIWPDNDKAGFEATESVCRELKRVGVASAQMIDQQVLQKRFPEKWDLADKLPNGVDQDLLQQLLLSAKQCAINPQQVLYRVSSLNRDPYAKARANEILWRVDDRLRSELESKFGEQIWKVDEEILAETTKILVSIEKQHRKEVRADSELNRRLAWQESIYRAGVGRDPSDWETERMKEIIVMHRNMTKGQNDLAVDCAIAKSCSEALSNKRVSGKGFQQELKLSAQTFDKSMETEKTVNKALSKQKVISFQENKFIN